MLAQTVAQHQGGVRIKVTSHEHLKNLIRELDIDPSDIIGLLCRLIQIAGPEKALETVGLDKMVKIIGWKRVMETIGLDNIIKTVGREKVLEIILPNLTKEQIKKLIEQNGNR